MPTWPLQRHIRNLPDYSFDLLYAACSEKRGMYFERKRNEFSKYFEKRVIKVIDAPIATLNLQSVFNIRRVIN